MNSIKSNMFLVFCLGVFINQAIAQVPSCVPSNGLVGWWPFTGNANDLSGNGNHGTVNGATLTTDRFGNANQAYSFDGVNDFVQCNQSGISGNSSVTVSFWIKSGIGSGHVFSYGGNGNSGNDFRVLINAYGNCGNSIAFDIYNSGKGLATTFGNYWDNYTIVYNALLGNSVLSSSIYKNGTLLSNSCFTLNAVAANFLNNFPITFGRYHGTIPSDYLNGQLDDIGIWNRALTQQEITNLYNANNGPQASISTPNNSLCAGQSTTLTASVANAGTSCNTAGLPPSLLNGLVGYWPFCGNANDASGNANNGTVNGATLTTDRFGVANSAYSFDGVNDNIRVNNNALFSFLLNSSFTTNLWFSVQVVPNGTKFLIGQGDSDAQHQNRFWGSYVNQSELRNWFRGNVESNQVWNISPLPSTNVWKMISMVRDYNNTIKMYVDGQLVDTDVDIAGFASPFTQIRDIYFGASYDAYNSQLQAFFNGKLDDIGIWNRALSAQELSQLYNAGQPTYAWSNGATTPVITVTPAQTTAYTCTVTMNGASTTQSQTITVNALPNVSAGQNQSVCVGTAVTLSGSGASSYSWNNGVNNGVAFTPASTQTYTVTGTDANGCSNTAQTTVTVNALPIVGAGSNQTVCAGTAVTLSGSGAASYTWNNGVTNAVTFTPNTTTTYTVTGTDANGCTNTAQTTVTVNALPTVGAGSNQTVCAGTQVTLSGSGAASYSWNNGVTNAVAFTPNATTTYTVSGTAANGCTNTAQVQVTVNALPTVNAGANQTVCAGASLALSGSGAQTYSWNNGVLNGIAFTPNNTQTYTVTGTDANGCTNTAQTTVTVNALPTVGAGSNQTVCAGTAVTLSGSGASIYSWNNGVNNGVAFTPASTQTYTVTGTAANGCTNTAQVTVTVNALPTVSAGINQTVCAGTAVTLNGSGASSYSWNNGVNNGVAFTPVSTQTYTVTGTDANGCTNTAQVTVTVNALPSVSAGTNQTVCTGTSVTLSGSGASTYTWNNGVLNGVAFTPNNTQTYTVTGTAANGCTNTAQVLVTVAIPSSSTITETACLSYILNGQSYTQSGTYEQNLTNVQGCDSTLTLTLTILPLPNVPNIYLALNNVMSTDAQPNTSYQWIFCASGLPIANATDTFYTATINGIYAVEASNSCGTVTSDCITISNSGLDEYVDQLKLFPNPTKDFLIIDGLKQSAINFELRDVTGRLILMGTLDASNNSLDMNPVSEGNYRLVLEGYGVFSLVKY